MSDWQPIETAPRDGTTVRLGHVMDPGSMKENTICPTRGSFENGRWELDSFFTCTDRMLRRIPTHWKPINQGEPK
jgi:hypothetical protein